MSIHKPRGPREEPTSADLAAIEAEWPLIEAELVELDCVVRIVTAGRDPSELEVRQWRRAQRRVLREMVTFLDAAELAHDGIEVA